MSDAAVAPARPAVFRPSPATYLLVAFLAAGATPLAFAGDIGEESSVATLGPRLAIYLIPVLVALFIRRTSTRIDADGVTIRAILGTRTLAWAHIRGLAINGSSLFVVTDEGSIRLPCVHEHDLAALTAASGGHLPQLPPEPVIPAPSGRRR